MNEVLEAAVAGASLAAGLAFWLLAGYLIQRFAFRNPKPTAGTVVATFLEHFNVVVFSWRPDDDPISISVFPAVPRVHRCTKAACAA